MTAIRPEPSYDRTQALSIAASVALAIGLAAIGGAWIFEYMGYQPCALCLQQRLPYYFGLPLALAALVIVLAAPRRAQAARLVMLLAGLMFLAGGVLGLYHAGVEWGFWPGPGSCTQTGAASSGGDLLEQMRATRIVPCDEAAWRFFGVSLAGYNAIASLAIAAMIGWALRKK